MKTVNKRFISVTDDLTGAADSGSYFTNRGMELTIYTGLSPEEIEVPETGNFSVNLSTRNASPEAAFAGHSAMFRKLEKQSDSIIMKKIGTGFRGRDPYEIGGILEADKRRVCFVVASAPDLGTFTLYGNQYCEGCILTKSLYAKDPVFPPEQSYIPDILREGLNCAVESIAIDVVKGDTGGLIGATEEALARGARVLVYDAITEEDGARLVSVLSPLYPRAVWTGSLGIGAALASYLLPEPERMPALGTPVEAQEEHRPDRCVCFTATAYEATREQIAFSGRQGLQRVTVDIDRIMDGDESCLRKAAEEYLEKTKRGNVILTPLVERYSYREGTSSRILSIISECAGIICEKAEFDRLVLIGGETAQHILQLLDIHVIALKKSPEVGVAVGVIKEGAYRGKRIALKGGSIGSQEALERMMGI